MTSKVAIVHDWLPLIGGAELVLKEILKVYPEADVYTLLNFLDERQLQSLGIKNLNVSYLNKWPGIKKYYRKLVLLYPQAIESFDLHDYELVISTSHLVAKGVITGAHQVHVSYVHSPARYAWDLMHHYLKQTNNDKGIKGYLAQWMLSRFRLWDYRTANGVNVYAANSNFIRKRIWKVYRREAKVIYPPVDVTQFTFRPDKENFYMTASRMVPYKRIDLIVKAFRNIPDKQLVVIGDGPEMGNISAIAAGAPNIRLLGYQDISVLKDHMQRARAFVFAAEEDFGIVPVEAQACGTPVLAYGAGGALETVISADESLENATGLYFAEQTAEAIQKAVLRFEALQTSIKPEKCRKNAEKFSGENFKNQLKDLVAEAFSEQEHLNKAS